MARKKKEDELAEIVNTLMTLSEASQWSEEHKAEFGLDKGLNTDTLKQACAHGRLKAALKGKNYLTREVELREYLEKFDPKNKRETRPLQARALRRREVKRQTEEAAQTGQTLTPSKPGRPRKAKTTEAAPVAS